MDIKEILTKVKSGEMTIAKAEKFLNLIFNPSQAQKPRDGSSKKPYIPGVDICPFKSNQRMMCSHSFNDGCNSCLVASGGHYST